MVITTTTFFFFHESDFESFLFVAFPAIFILCPLDGYSAADKCMAYMSEATAFLATNLVFLYQVNDLYSNTWHAFKDRWCEAVLYKFTCFWVTGDFPLYIKYGVMGELSLQDPFLCTGPCRFWVSSQQ